VILNVTAARCGGTAQASRSLSITPLATATVTAPTIVRGDGQAAILRIDLTGTPPWQVKWRDIAQELTIYGSPAFREVSPTPAVTTTYWLDTVSSGGCSATVNAPGTVHVLPPAPNTVSAQTRTDDTHVVDVTWSAVGGATAYLIERAVQRGGFPTYTQVVGSASTAYPDTTIPATTDPVTYIYYVRTIDGETSPRGAYDFATAASVMYQHPIVAGATLVRAVELTELRKGVNAFRTAFGLSPASWSATSIGEVIRASHFAEIVSALNVGRGFAGYPAFVYVGVPAPAAGGTILGAHVLQLRDALR
jgi:hypothetical protein